MHVSGSICRTTVPSNEPNVNPEHSSSSSKETLRQGSSEAYFFQCISFHLDMRESPQGLSSLEDPDQLKWLWSFCCRGIVSSSSGLQTVSLLIVSLSLTPNQQIDSFDSFGIRKPTAVCCRWKNHQLFKLTKELLLSHTHAHTSCCVVDVCIYWQRVCAHVLFSSSVSPTCH